MQVPTHTFRIQGPLYRIVAEWSTAEAKYMQVPTHTFRIQGPLYRIVAEWSTAKAK
jgi:hypothetical protein